jgi:hypothetical protein
MEKFGWRPIKKTRRSVFFRMEKLILVLVREDQLAQELCTWHEDLSTNKFFLTIGFSSEKELERKFSELRTNGVTIIKEPRKISGGICKGLIMDPEDNFWELAFYPFSEMDRNSETLSFHETMN